MKLSGFSQMSPLGYLFYSILHPSDSFQEMKYNKKSSRLIMVIIVIVWMVEELLTRIFTDYEMNGYSNADESLFRVAVITCMTFVIAVVSNWCFCTLLNGKGRLADIAVIGAYSLTPYIITRFLIMLLSHVVTVEIGVFLGYFLAISILWSFIRVFIGLKVIHEYSTLMTIASVLLTVVGILIIMFICMIAVQLYQQIFMFISTILIELRYS